MTLLSMFQVGCGGGSWNANMPVEGETYDDDSNILNKVQIDHDAAKAN